MSRSKMGERAAGRPIRIRTVVVLLVLLPMGYAAAAYGPAYWGYVRMLTPVHEAALAAAAQRWDGNPRIEQHKQAWKDGLVSQALEVGVVLPEDAITIDRVGLEAVVRVAWRVPVYHPYAQHEIAFQVESRQSFLPN
jgi:hypothetical protein